MPNELPIACSLGVAELPARLAEMAALGDAALIGTHHEANRAELRFAADADVRRRVDAIVAAESQCCAFLDMQVSEAHDVIVVTVGAPEGAELVLGELVDAFGGRSASA